ncbi:MAG TPA: hydroxyphenylacetyl-CoA thioesterase PaaI [Gammaproteobacteria bacterium]|jgi:acyl-CoA thioesterase|nr:hydroxyphenylacetyl-CoA thioesterase PaaI [Gammaproteobacteria bacterium]
MTDENPPSTLSPQALAEACSAALAKDDHCAHALGIEVTHVEPGRAVLSMRVREDMLNGHNICHGGMLFTLADTAFAHACNSGNRNTVASACHIDYLAPGHVHDTLTAVAQARSRAGRTGVYDIEICNQDQVTIALFRGKSFQIQGNLVTPDGEQL